MATLSSRAGPGYYYSASAPNDSRAPKVELQYWRLKYADVSDFDVLGWTTEMCPLLEEVEVFGSDQIISTDSWRFFDAKTSLEFDLVTSAPPNLPIVHLQDPNQFLKLGTCQWNWFQKIETPLLSAATARDFSDNVRDLNRTAFFSTVLRFREREEKEWPVTLVQKTEGRVAYSATEPLSRTRYFELRAERIHDLRLRLRRGWRQFMVNP